MYVYNTAFYSKHTRDYFSQAANKSTFNLYTAESSLCIENHPKQNCNIFAESQ